MTLVTRVVLLAYKIQFSVRWNVWAISTNLRHKLCRIPLRGV